MAESMKKRIAWALKSLPVAFSQWWRLRLRKIVNHALSMQTEELLYMENTLLVCVHRQLLPFCRVQRMHGKIEKHKTYWIWWDDMMSGTRLRFQKFFGKKSILCFSCLWQRYYARGQNTHPWWRELHRWMTLQCKSSWYFHVIPLQLKD